MTERGLTIDPGVSNGMCEFTFSDTQPFQIENLWQFKGGAGALGAALDSLDLRRSHRFVDEGGLVMGVNQLNHLIVERFTPRQNAGFNLSLDDVEPLRGEGAILGKGFGEFIQWREPKQQYFMSPPNTALKQKKKDARRFLETFGIKPTGSVVYAPDADDAISAILHSIAWLRRQKHMPTIMKFFPPTTTP